MLFKSTDKDVLVSIIMCSRENVLKEDRNTWLEDEQCYRNLHITEQMILKYASCCKTTLRNSLDTLVANGRLAIRRDGRANAYDILLPLQDIETLYHNEAASRCIFGC